MVAWRRSVALAAVSASLAANPPAPPVASAVAWPEADALFHQDPRWLGSDCAYSVDLGNGRVLWLFGDTFVATSAAHRRRESKMIRNSVGIQEGYDPSSARIRFHWRTRADVPASFFPDADWGWHWPGGGLRIDDLLLLFFMKVRRTGDGMFGFDAFAPAAVAIDNPGQAPDQWHLRWLELPPNKFKVMVGSGSALRLGGHVLAYGSAESGPHDIFLVRWTLAAIRRLDLSQPEWWHAAENRWISQQELQGRPPPVFTDGQTEFTVHREARVDRYLEVQTHGFGDAELALRWATTPTGPWSKLQPFHRPEEAARPGVMIYAGKAHPELVGADLVVTYATNTEWERGLDDPSLYYPRFLKVTFERDPTTSR